MNDFDIYEQNPFFEQVQLQRIFPDGKTFVDCMPKYGIDKIKSEYISRKDSPGFDLKAFILENFELPVPHSTNYTSNTQKSVEENIEILWDVLTRQPGSNSGAIALPFPYIVPGGRFGEIYYWDSYFTMLGLKASGRTEMVENMVKNFAYLIDKLGYIPNGNRSYFIGRSQPPFFSLMVKMLGELQGDIILTTYLPQLEKEYAFWMMGATTLDKNNPSFAHVLSMPDGEVLNRYWDEHNTPRPESFREDKELAHASAQDASQLFRNLRAGAESGWDYTYRWFKDEDDFSTIHTTDIVPVDLNSLLYHLEQTIADAYELKGDTVNTETYRSIAAKRAAAIEKYCWSDEFGFYFDFDVVEQKRKLASSIAAAVPLFVKIATDQQAASVADIISKKFLKPGGVVGTLKESGQQWDAPNGWAPLQWMTITGLQNYKEHTLAKEIAERWIKLNNDVFKRTGKLMEKYNVVDTQVEAGGGEYEGQDGFGWTNGVLLALIKSYGIPS